MPLSTAPALSRTRLRWISRVRVYCCKRHMRAGRPISSTCRSSELIAAPIPTTAKRATEVVIERGPLPWTIVRATQFHNLVLGLIQSFGADTLPLVPVPGAMRFQSIDVGEVAERLVALVQAAPAGHAP